MLTGEKGFKFSSTHFGGHCSVQEMTEAMWRYTMLSDVSVNETSKQPNGNFHIIGKCMKFFLFVILQCSSLETGKSLHENIRKSQWKVNIRVSTINIIDWYMDIYMPCSLTIVALACWFSSYLSFLNRKMLQG